MQPSQRAAIFWLVCIPVRTYLTHLARKRHPLLRPFAAFIAFRWLQGLEVGYEGFFGGPAWWADLRPMHGKLWALYAATGKWQFVAVDTLAGAAAWKLIVPSLQPSPEPLTPPSSQRQTEYLTSTSP